MSITINAATIASNQVFSTAPLNIHADAMLIAWARRSTTTNPVPTAERYRGIVIDKAACAVPADACSSKFQRLLQSTMHDLAAGMFQNWAKDNVHASTYDGAPINIDNALAYWADKKQREIVDGAAVLAWLEASATFKTLTTAQAAVWKVKVPKIAAPAYKGSFTAAEASKIITRFVDEDAETAIGLFVMQRLANITQEQSQEDML